MPFFFFSTKKSDVLHPIFILYTYLTKNKIYDIILSEQKENCKPERRGRMASKASLETAMRNDCLALVKECLEKHYNCTVMPVSASELAVPVTDAEGQEKFLLVKVSVPRGTRDGEGGYIPYDGYTAADDYKFEQEERAAKKAAAEEKKKKLQAKKTKVGKAIENLEKAGLG